MSEQYLLLKWGGLKDWNLEGNEKAIALLNKFYDEPVSSSAMLQKNTATQTQIICDLIDCVDGEIINDWSGERYSKDEAKKYILEYRT